MKAEAIPDLHERLRALEGVLAHVVGLLARDPSACAELQQLRAGALGGFAKHARAGPNHPEQEAIAEALHQAWSDLLKHVPRSPPGE